MNDLLGKVVCGLESCTRGNGICQGVHCPYHISRDEARLCRINLLFDVCSLLQIDANAPRVMTLEEVRRCGYHVFIELKDKNVAETIGSTDPEDLKEFKSLYSAFWHLHWRSGNVMLEEFYLGIPSNRDYKETDKYNVTWRCWDKLPPGRLMETTRWKV